MAINGISTLNTGPAVAPPDIATLSSKPIAPAASPKATDSAANISDAKPIQAPAPNEGDIKSAVSTINNYLKPSSNNIQFVQDKDSGITLVQIVDTATGTVVRQIPTQQVVDISRDLAKLQGLLVKEKA